MIRRGLAAGLVAITLWAYQSVWTAGWVYEDQITQSYPSRWLTTWTWTLVNSPRGAHAFNLGLFLILAGLVVAFASRLGVRGLGLWAVAGIWLVHPMNVETVAYAASRGELLAAIFIVSACCASIGDWWRWPALATIVGSLWLAIGAKESGVVGLLLVPLVVAYTQTSGWRRWLPSAIGAVAIIVGLWWVGGIAFVMNRGGTDFVPAESISGLSWIGLQSAALHRWLGASIWLTGLTPDADIDAVPMTGRLLSVCVLIGLGLWAWACRHRAPLVAFGLAWCLIAVAPRFLVKTPQSYLNAHQFTVPFIGLVLIAGYGVRRLDDWWSA